MLSALYARLMARKHCTTDPSVGNYLQVGANRSLLLRTSFDVSLNVRMVSRNRSG